MDIHFPKFDEIKDIGEFLEDKKSQKYGFTVLYKSGKIENIYVEGNYYEKKDEVVSLKENYQKLLKQVKKEN